MRKDFSLRLRSLRLKSLDAQIEKVFFFFMLLFLHIIIFSAVTCLTYILQMLPSRALCWSSINLVKIKRSLALPEASLNYERKPGDVKVKFLKLLLCRDTLCQAVLS